MKCFIKGIVGAAFVLLIVVFITPLYSDYRAAAEVDDWLSQAQALQDSIEKYYLENKTMVGVEKTVEITAFSPDNISYFEITSQGRIMIKGGSDGQLIIISPSIEREKINWKCLGGSDSSVSQKCK